MPSFATLLALAAPLAVLSAPVRREADPTDLLVLKFADVLEQLESQFYQQALQKFQPSDFTNAGFADAQIPVQQFNTIQKDEATHSVVLRSVLKSFASGPVDTCKFDFGSVLNDVPTMAATARAVENVGVAAYLGAAHLITDPAILTAAGSILTVEARHSTILNVLSNGVSVPQAFDIALLPNEVLAIAGGFISGCDLGVPANAALAIKNSGTPGPGTKLEFDSPAFNGSKDGFHCQMLTGGAGFSISLPLDNCVVPDGIQGPVALFVTNDAQPLTGNVKDRAGTKTIVAGPAIAFIDTERELLGQLVLANKNSDSKTTNTITPPEASSIIASASSTGSGAQPTNTSGSDSQNSSNGSNSGNGSATSSGSAAQPTSSNGAVVNSADKPESDKTVVEAPGTRNLFKGTLGNGAIEVIGWNDQV